MKKLIFLHPKSHCDFGTDLHLQRDPDPDPNPDPLVRGTNLTIRIRVRIPTKMSRIRKTDENNRKLECVGLSSLGMETQFASVCLASSPSQTPSQVGHELYL